MSTKTKQTLVSPRGIGLLPNIDYRYMPGTSKKYAYCYKVETFLLGVPRYKVETITSDNDTLTLPLVSRPCTHTVTYDAVDSAGSCSEWYPTIGWVPTGVVPSMYYVDPGIRALAELVPSAYPTFTDAELRVAASEAFKATRPSFTSEFSLINFVLELRDFNRMFEFINTKWSLKEHVENNFLNWNFGWKPFASDLVHLHDAYIRTKSVWKHILDNSEGEIVTSTATKNVSKTQTNNIVGYYRTDVNRKIVSTKVQTRYQYDVLDTTTGNRTTVPTDLYALSVAQALGITANPAIVWEALPFSFVIDWFIPIKSALEEMKKDTFVPGHRIISCDKHVKTTNEWTTKGQFKLNVTKFSASASWRTYSRNPATESGFDLDPLDKLSISGPTGNQWFLGAILGSSIFL